MTSEILSFTNKVLHATAEQSQRRLKEVMKFSNITDFEVNKLLKIITQNACINLHFHPDILSKDGIVIEGLLASGQYKNQYQTHISSGSLSAFVNGERDNWENELFGNILKNELVENRPKYGSLNLTLTMDGASPRFGSCYFVTKPEVKNRSTFTYGDSHLLPKERGTIVNFYQIILGIFEDIFFRNFTLGFQYESVESFISQTINKLENKLIDSNVSRNLDFYIEAQIHGPISLRDDITDLVVDHSYKNTFYEDCFQYLCDNYQINLKWNTGFELSDDAFPINFRGNEIPTFVKNISEYGKVNAFIIGKSIVSKKLVDKYSTHDLFQLYKYVWHCLVKFGKPISISQ